MDERLENVPETSQVALRKMNAEVGKVFVAIAPFGWGKDRNAGKAFTIAKRHGSTGEDLTATIVEVPGPEGAFVDQMGRLIWEGKPEDARPVAKVVYSKR